MIVFRRGFYLRVALIADLWVYLLAVVLLEVLNLFPSREVPTLLVSGPWMIALIAIIPAILLFGRLVDKPRVPLNEWAYLATAAYGLFILFGFYLAIFRAIDVDTNRIVVISAFVLIGVVGSLGAHILDGGKNPIGPVVERRVDQSHDD